MDTQEMVAFHGYPVLKYKVTTTDGYILTVFRIPGRYNETVPKALREAKSKHPVLLLHGLNSNSKTFIITGNEEGHGKAIPYQLADEGYDVWLINFRGNSYSREHMWLSADTDPDFWDYSFEE